MLWNELLSSIPCRVFAMGKGQGWGDEAGSLEP